ncbi:hypothetical protein NPIL_164361 [Nephila pilipes]|uniref:Uncharacterized protein n=1 Tax=Nephila pilipes TaxID=299642 RepID=A0A8X6Q4K6_NEPPI|nr:hypothetical protein NPIL_164361 [Nephila pilipes]
MYPLERSARVSDQHFLLDTHDLHGALCLRKGGRQRRSPSRYRLDPGRFSVPIPPLLSVGVFHTVLPSGPILHPQVAVAHVGRRQDPGPDDGLGYCPVWRSGEEAEKEAARGLLNEQSETARLVCGEILSVRGHGIRKRCRTNVSHEPILRRRIFELRHRGDPVLGEGPGDSNRSNDPNLPACHQVSLLQVRILGQRGDARRALRLATQRHQREDIHLPLVLVHHPVRVDRTGACLPSGHCRLSPRQSLPAQHEVQDRSFGQSTYRSSQGIYRGLVSSVHARTKHRYNDLQGSAGRDGQEDDYRTEGGGMT